VPAVNCVKLLHCLLEEDDDDVLMTPYPDIDYDVMMMLDEESGVFAACKKRFLEDAL